MQNVLYNYSSTQQYLPAALAQEVIEWGYKHVPDRDLYTDSTDPSFGRENEIHITVLYGIHTEDPRKVQTLLEGIKPIECALDRMSIFTSSKFDVLKIDVQSAALYALNKKMQTLEYTNGYPLYRPHVTIAYILKGRGNRFVNCKAFKDRTFMMKEVIFSSRLGDKIILPIGQSPDSSRKIDTFHSTSALPPQVATLPNQSSPWTKQVVPGVA